MIRTSSRWFIARCRAFSGIARRKTPRYPFCVTTATTSWPPAAPLSSTLFTITALCKPGLKQLLKSLRDVGINGFIVVRWSAEISCQIPAPIRDSDTTTSTFANASPLFDHGVICVGHFARGSILQTENAYIRFTSFQHGQILWHLIRRCNFPNIL